MAALPDPLSSQTPLPAASGIADYPQFTAFSVPYEIGARSAYKGFIRPFSDDATARRVLQAFEEELPVQVSGGRLEAYATVLKPHKYDDLLVGMTVPFTILLLEFSGTEHPRAFLLDPPTIPGLSQSPHLRTDKPVEIDGKSYPALCVYSGSLYQYESDRSRLEQFLDQTATYLAKYLIWLRTRKLCRSTSHGPEPVLSRIQTGTVHLTEQQRSRGLFYAGYWPGRSAPAGPMAHLATIKPDDQCWCWSGDNYGDCCRPRDLAAKTEYENRQARIRLVGKLMAAVKARL
ncbi:MAG: SEC-C domain-containing protein [Terracidiphilus sp.]|jgi:hypothetical protein